MMSLPSILLLSLHLWCMNLAAALPLLAMCLNLRRWPPSSGETAESAARLQPPNQQLSREVAVQSIVMLAVGIAFGLALGTLQVWQGDRALWEIVPRFSRKIHWGIWELVFSFGCMSIYVAISRRNFRSVRVIQAILALLSATNLLYHFPPLFTVMVQAAKTPEMVSQQVTASEFRSLMLQGHVIPLSVHFALASLAVAGAELLNRCATISSQRNPTIDSAAANRFGKFGAAVALAATAAQLLAGIWLLLRLDAFDQHELTGGNLWATGLLASSVMATFGLLHLMAGALFGPLHVRTARIIRWILLAVIFVMCAVLKSLS